MKREKNLASYAVDERESKGRMYNSFIGIDINEKESQFSKDYRRVIYSSSFNRLKDKTQVFPATSDSSNYLTRLTHSLEVSKLSETTAKELNLNSDLAQTLGILHDIGHAPFGHLGQDVLNELMREHGGFEHNFQALRIVDLLESHNSHYEGLNLMFETREGLLKHCSEKNAILLEEENKIRNSINGTTLPSVGERHIKKQNSSLESQLVDYCDSISYLHSDLIDAFKNGILTIDTIKKAPGFQRSLEYYQKKCGAPEMPTQKEYDDAMINNNRTRLSKIKQYVEDVINIMLKKTIDDLKIESKNNILDAHVKSVDDVKNYMTGIIGISDDQYQIHRGLKDYSRKEIYHHPIIHNDRFEQADILVGLFNAYMKKPEYMCGIGIRDGQSVERSVADNISGMADRFAISSYNKIKELDPSLLEGRFKLPNDFEISADKKTEKKRLGIG